MPVNVPPPAPNPPADANFVLKFTYGVNAYKHWVLQKNAQIEKAAAASGQSTTGRLGGPPRGFRPMKLDPLHCTADELNCALCMFVREVRKPNGDQYAPDSILYLCLGTFGLLLSRPFNPPTYTTIPYYYCLLLIPACFKITLGAR